MVAAARNDYFSLWHVKGSVTTQPTVANQSSSETFHPAVAGGWIGSSTIPFPRIRTECAALELFHARKRSPAREVGPLMIATERPAAPFLRIVEEAAGYGLFEVLHSLG